MKNKKVKQMMYDIIVDKNDGDGMKDDRWRLTPHYMFEYAETILCCTMNGRRALMSIKANEANK